MHGHDTIDSKQIAQINRNLQIEWIEHMIGKEIESDARVNQQNWISGQKALAAVSVHLVGGTNAQLTIIWVYFSFGVSYLQISRNFSDLTGSITCHAHLKH